MSEIAANVDQNPRPAPKLQNLVTLAIRSFIASAIVAGGICLKYPEGTSDALKKLRMLTPETIISLLDDATVGCQTVTPPPFIQCTDNPGKLCIPGPEDLRRMKALISRECTKPIVDGWPATGNWLPRTTGYRWTGIFGFFVAATDVAVHLVVPTTVSGSETSKGAKAIVGFVGLLQIVFGLGITVAILKPVSRGLNELWFAALAVLGTLILGSAVAWAMLPAITFLFKTMVSLKTGLSASFVGAIAVTYASGIAIIKYFLDKPLHRISDAATDSAAEKVARWFIRYVP
jgi:hypothetical protein